MNGLHVLGREGVGDPLEYCPQGGCRVQGKLQLTHWHGSHMLVFEIVTQNDAFVMWKDVVVKVQRSSDLSLLKLVN